MTTLFGYYGLGLASLNAARTGIEVAGDNIANINTPGFSRRRMILEPGLPYRVPGGVLSQGVNIAEVRRQQDGLLQFSLGRERASFAGSEESLRGLQQIELVFGSVQGDNLSSSYASFSGAFSELASQPEDLAQRRSAIAAADALAQEFRSSYGRLERQARDEDQSVRSSVKQINALAEELAQLNRAIATSEPGAGENSPLRDQRDQVVSELAKLTGGNAVPTKSGRLQFELPGGGTLVTAERARPLETSLATDGTTQVALDGNDVTGRLRTGKLGALIELRDETIPAQLAQLDTLAADLISRTNAITTGATDLNGDPGGGLFDPDPPPATGAAKAIAVRDAVLGDPRLLAVSTTGAPGDGSGAVAIAALRETASAGLGDQPPSQFIGDMVAKLGTAIATADVETEKAFAMVRRLEARREQVSGVSLDEEAVDIIRYQRSYEAAARFITVLNEMTEIAVNLGR